MDDEATMSQAPRNSSGMACTQKSRHNQAAISAFSRRITRTFNSSDGQPIARLCLTVSPRPQNRAVSRLREQLVLRCGPRLRTVENSASARRNFVSCSRATRIIHAIRRKRMRVRVDEPGRTARPVVPTTSASLGKLVDFSELPTAAIADAPVS